jgi:hypothetical protein
VIRFGLHLTLRGGRDALARLVITATAVAVGVGLLLATLAAIHAVEAQNARYAWLNSGVPEAIAPDAVPSPDPLWGALSMDRYAGSRILRVDVAATGPESPVPPGLPRLPRPGEYYASPALRHLLALAPPDELGDRYPGRLAGTIGAAALPSPDSLIAVVGRTAANLSRLPGAAQVATIATESPGGCGRCQMGTNADGMALVLSVTAVALLFPVLVLIGTATRLAAVRREQRFAAMRLVGATPGQVAVVASVESTVAAVVGTVVGFGVFALVRGPLSTVPLTGERFYPSDLALTPLDVSLVAVGVPIGASVVALVASRRVRISPLGVSRRVTPRPPRAVRLLPLVAGVAELTWFIGRRPYTTNGQLLAYLTGIFLIMGGLVIAGPWLTMVGARLLARLSNRPATLLAARRLADDPRAGFRAVSGVALALFVTSTAVGVMTTMIAERGAPTGDLAVTRTLVLELTRGRTPGGEEAAAVDRLPASLGTGLDGIQGVRGWLPLHTNPLGTEVPVGPFSMAADLVACRDLAALPDLGECRAGADVVSVPPGFMAIDQSSWRGTRWPTAPISAAELVRLPVDGVVVGTDGSTAAIERARTVLAVAFPERATAATVGEQGPDAGIAEQLAGFQRLADVVTVGALCIAGCSLAVSVVGGLTDRRRPFSLLRLAGVPLRSLRRSLALETAVPLLSVAGVAAVMGFVAAALFLRSQMDYALSPPGRGYFVTVLVGLAASLAVVATTMPLLGRLTGPETARNE